MDQIISEELREHIVSLDKKLDQFNGWVFRRTTDYFGEHYVVNDKTRNLYKELRPILNEIYESLLCLSILTKQLGEEG